jgi:SAM-dependent methyltransferase/alkylhydroperoxidase family enzyme
METHDWHVVDEGWGRKAVDFAAMTEPSNCREYLALHQRLDVGPGDRLLDVACGSGLALELAAIRGATCAGIDASSRLLAVARDRSPEADIRLGDMHALPWVDGTFDVVTSFRGIWGTTPDALAEVRRVLVPGGRLGLTVWGHIKASTGAWALSPFTLATEPKVANQAAMVALGRPGAGEELLGRFGFVDVERLDVPFALECADPEGYARALASTGPAYEAIQAVGEEAFLEHATELARQRVRDGLPLRAEIKVVGFVARTPAVPRRRARADESAGNGDRRVSDAGFLGPPPDTTDTQRLYDADVDQLGYVMNVSRLWAHQPALHEAMFGLIGQAVRAGSLTFRQRGILVAACASAFGDSYCSLAWGKKLAGEAGPDVAGSVLRGDDGHLDPAERALARWARKVALDPNGTRPGDLDALREAGYDDAQILAITTFVALRIGFSTVNDALGTRPDRELRETAPEPVLEAVTFGRPIAGADA